MFYPALLSIKLILLTLCNAAYVCYFKGDASTTTKTLIKLTNICYSTIEQNDLPENNRKDTVIILIRALSFLANA